MKSGVETKLVLVALALATGLGGCGDGNGNRDAAQIANISGGSTGEPSNLTPDVSPIATNCDE
jgi:hypothetical protein